MIENTKQTEQTKQAELEIKENESEAINNEPFCSNADKEYGKNKKCECPYVTGEQLTLKTIANIVYVCQALSFFFGITAIIGVILNYLRRDEANGMWLESHFTWQIRTFWVGLGVAIVGYIFIFIGIGFLILAANLVWIIYRVVKGWVLLREGRAINNHLALL